MGSLGFLCPFDFDDYREYMNGVIKGRILFNDFILRFLNEKEKKQVFNFEINSAK